MLISLKYPYKWVLLLIENNTPIFLYYLFFIVLFGILLFYQIVLFYFIISPLILFMHFSTNFLLWCMMTFFAWQYGIILVCFVFIFTPTVKNTDSWKAPDSENTRWQLALIQKGANLSYFAYVDSQKNLMGLTWMNIHLIFFYSFLRSSLLVLGEVSVIKCVQLIGC